MNRGGPTGPPRSWSSLAAQPSWPRIAPVGEVRRMNVHVVPGGVLEDLLDERTRCADAALHGAVSVRRDQRDDHGAGNTCGAQVDVCGCSRQRDVARGDRVTDLALADAQSDGGRAGSIRITGARGLCGACQIRGQPYASPGGRENGPRASRGGRRNEVARMRDVPLEHRLRDRDLRVGLLRGHGPMADGRLGGLGGRCGLRDRKPTHGDDPGEESNRDSSQSHENPLSASALPASQRVDAQVRGVFANALRSATWVRHCCQLTFRVPSMPPSRWPGTAQ